VFDTDVLNGLGSVLAVESGEPVSGGGVGMGALVLTMAISLLLGWMGYLYVNTLRARASASEAAPPNLSPPLSDDELENAKLTRVLRAALFGSILLAVAMPWYAVNEPERQQIAVDRIADHDIDEGAHWYGVTGFQCVDCHGPSAGGGNVDFVEPRSGVASTWKVPPLNDIFFRYTEDEVKHWIVFGRAGTPMPANGLDGGGAMTVQEVDQVVAYLQSIQISQEVAFAQSESATSLAIAAIEGGAVAAASFVAAQEAEIALVKDAARQISIVGTFPDDIKDLLQTDGTCTEESAALVVALCDNPGADTDRDGLADAAEDQLTEMAAVSLETVIGAAPREKAVYAFSFDSFNAFTNDDPETRSPLPDLDAAEELLEKLETEVLLLNVTADREDVFLSDLEAGLAFLQAAASAELWAVDYEAKAAEMGVSIEEAMQAAGLFNAYCSRCHTGGYSSGQPFEQGQGSGAWGPSLLNNRAVIQFPSLQDHVAFVISGSEDSKRFGVNGLGSGRMPAFGLILSETQIELIALYERTL